MIKRSEINDYNITPILPPKELKILNKYRITHIESISELSLTVEIGQTLKLWNFLKTGFL